MCTLNDIRVGLSQQACSITDAQLLRFYQSGVVLMGDELRQILGASSTGRQTYPLTAATSYPLPTNAIGITGFFSGCDENACASLPGSCFTGKKDYFYVDGDNLVVAPLADRTSGFTSITIEYTKDIAAGVTNTSSPLPFSNMECRRLLPILSTMIMAMYFNETGAEEERLASISSLKDMASASMAKISVIGIGGLSYNAGETSCCGFVGTNKTTSNQCQC